MWSTVYKRIEPLLPLLFALGLLFLAWQIASVFWLIKSKPTAINAQDIPLLQPPMPIAIGNFRLFAEPQADTAPVATSIDVPLSLEGVLLGKGVRSSALIKVNNQSKNYRVGQTLEGTQIELVDVAWDHIVLKPAGGSPSKLKFGATQTEPIASTPSVMSSLVQPAGPLLTPDMAPSGPMTPEQRMAAGASNPFMANSAMRQRAQVDSAIDNAVDQLKTNPSAYLSKMGVNPTSGGYEVGNGSGGAFFSKLGLQPGDKVVSVNGKPLGEVRQDAALLAQIKQERRAEIVVQRGGQSLTLAQQW